ncbi:ABC transporter ATP-binding protein [Haloechinothrix sp. LS1_15]|uniref:ABC transporter ATP-binding protein n=1 Tax=Haloechinothrix sp. LS1_15 TaxID=2652248 RepID=UPI002946783F|nr:ABC transporter ATP-binding protein [Haloechinothrix sp. LS1_15]MDV6011091.1 ABC transporter ATP-binding protein [Haloechinothrix sp. LS1_15]
MAEPDPSPVSAAATGQPTVIVDDLHVVYRVIGASNKEEKGNAATAFKRLLLRQKQPSVKEVHAIRGISFTAYEGDAIGVVGRNGSGKSTLMRAIAGLLPAANGAVYAQGQPSFLGVNAALMSGLTGERNIELGCLAMGMSREEARERHDEIVEFSGLGEHIKMPMRTYSTGMGARLRFAIAAAKSHDVLIVDEALATGDRDFRKKSERRIQELRKEAGTVFLVSHSMKQIIRTCNRAIWVEKGLLRMDGDPESVVQAYLDENS